MKRESVSNWTMSESDRVVRVEMADGTVRRSKPTRLRHDEIMKLQIRCHSVDQFIERINRHKRTFKDDHDAEQ